MPTASPATFFCPACDHVYPWKQKNVGRRAQCKCGSVLTVPKQPSGGATASPNAPAVPPPPAARAPAVADDADDYDLADDDLVVDDLPKPQGRICGGCGTPLDAKAVICVACGMDFRTGKKIGMGAPAAASPVANNRFAGVVRPPAAVKVEEPTAPIVPIIGGLLLLAIIGVGIVAGVGRLSGGEDLSNLHWEDQEALEILDYENEEEALAWLDKGRGRMLGNTSESQARNRIQQWYDMGAKNVYAYGMRMTMRSVVELPTDPAQREKFFEWRNRNLTEFDQPILDEGQKYMVYNWL
jgi:hypothetical protein